MGRILLHMNLENSAGGQRVNTVESQNQPSTQQAETAASAQRETLHQAEKPVEEQAQLWEEQLRGRVGASISSLKTRIHSRVSLFVPTWRAERSARLAEEAKADVGFFRGKVRDLRIQETQDRADIIRLKAEAMRPDQNVVTRTWNKANLKLALWGANWKKSSRASYESKLTSAEGRLNTKLQNANTLRSSGI